MQWHPVSARINLPAPWYFTVDELCQEWGCHPDRVYYYMDSGQLVPSALIPKWRLPAELQQGVAPSICFTLEDYRSLQWMHASDDAETWLTGEFLAFYVDRGGFRNLRLQVTDPLRITRRELVVLLEQKEALEESGAQKRLGAINKAERRTLLYIIRALALAAYEKDLSRPYTVATKVCERADLIGINLSRETVAQKLKDAAALDSPRVL
jgi:hypothetical protein